MSKIICTGQSFTIRQKVNIHYCAECQMPYSLTEELEQRLRVSGDSFFCPLGHSQHFPENSSQVKADNETATEREQREENIRDGESWKYAGKDSKPDPDREAKSKKIRELHELEQAEARLANKDVPQRAEPNDEPAFEWRNAHGHNEAVCLICHRLAAKIPGYTVKSYRSPSWLAAHLRKHGLSLTIVECFPPKV